ncbi:MFS transporter [Gaiella sp.]|uniref:MFS transporter n=1 Tax=Gaiella sp. TaxID=2663207 RepID=UPI002E304BDA|nr:MFS transporter [Gaiella sp.]HEX5584287.1 MFS transporter [Gaiella sp.]
MTPRAATSVCFFVNGALVGTWVAQIPFVQQRFDVSKTTIGLVILFMAAGAFVAMPLTGQVLDRRSSARVLRAAALVYPPLILLPLGAPGPVTLAAALVVFGAANGAVDVSMNAHGVAVERAGGKPIMSSLHACWSFGGLAGAGAVAAAVALGADPRAVGAVAALVLWVVVALATSALGGVSLHAGPGERSPGFALPSRAVLLIGALCFLVMTTEGAVADWAGIYLTGEAGASRAASATGFAGFSLGMALARLAGDGLVERSSRRLVLVGGAALAAVSLATLLVTGQAAVAVVGFVLVGIGVANAVPLLFSAAGRVPPAGPSLAAAFTIGYLGFIAGPPVIGVLADAVTLPAALALVCAALVLVAALGGRAVGESRALGRHEPLIAERSSRSSGKA